MKIKDLIDELMKREGGKKQINRAQMSEIVGHLSDIVFEECEEAEITPPAFDANFGIMLHANGKRRAKRKAKK